MRFDLDRKAQELLGRETKSEPRLGFIGVTGLGVIGVTGFGEDNQ